MSRRRKGFQLSKMTAGVIIVTIGALLFLVLMVQFVMENATLD